MKGKKALLNIISGVDSYYRDLLADDFETIYEDLKKLEVLEILKKHHLIGDIDVQKVDVADAKGTHIEYELSCDFMTIFIPEEEYKVLKEWLKNDK